MKLFIVRHGETEDNLKGVVQGHRPGTLSPQGKAQVGRLALRLSEEPIQFIFSSDLQRAKETTEEIARFHAAPIHYTSDLRERCAGVYEGQPRKPLVSRLASVDFLPEGGESLSQLKDRVDRFVERLLPQCNVESLLISSHGGWNRMLLGKLLKKSIEACMEFPQNNACLNVIEVVSPEQSDICLLNCTRHIISTLS